MASPDRTEVARQEKERLRLHMQQKKHLVEKMREEQNQKAVSGDVSTWRRRKCRLPYAHGMLTCTTVLQAARESNRLQFLLRQAEIFQHFAPAAAVEKAKK